MDIRTSTEEVRWQLREAAEDARWNVREALWTAEERALWPAADAARSAAHRAQRAVSPLQRLIQTRLTWPIADRMEEYGTGTRTAVATAGVVMALGAGVAGATVASEGGSPTGETVIAQAAAPVQVTAPQATLEGVKPDFSTDPARPAGDDGPALKTSAHQRAGEEPRLTKIAIDSQTPPDQVALAFTEAFVRYEVGRSDGPTTQVLSASATEPLAKALEGDPPRLPDGDVKVPQAEVLNIVPGEREGKRMTVSISLLRLRAASELRLTLVEGPKGWRVAEVLG